MLRTASSGTGETSDQVLEMSLLGLPVRLHFPTPQSRAEAAEDWSRCLGYPGFAGGFVDITVGEDGKAEYLSYRYPLTVRLTNLAIEHQAGRLLMFHACGLSDGAGHGIALVGRSGAGKTTAALTLARAEYSYLTDETLAVSHDMSVLPFPRPLSTIDTGRQGSKAQVGPDAAGLRRPPSEVKLHRIVVLDRENQQGHPEVKRLDLIDGLIELIPHTSALAALEKPLQLLARQVGECGGCYLLRYKEIADVGPSIAGLANAPTTADGWQAIDDRGDQVNPMSWALRDGRVRRAPYVDAIRVGQEALLMVGRRPVRLAGIGLSIWFAAFSAPTMAELVEEIIDQHGYHPEAEQLVRDGVAALCEASVLGYERPESVWRVLAGSLQAKRGKGHGGGGSCETQDHTAAIA